VLPPIDSTRLDCALWPLSECSAMCDAAVRHLMPSASVRSPLGSTPSVCWSSVDVDCEGVSLRAASLRKQLARVAPAAIELTGRGYILLLQFGSSHVKVLAPGGVARIGSEEILNILLRDGGASFLTDIRAVLDRSDVRGRRRAKAEQALLELRLRDRTLATAWKVRAPAGSNFLVELRDTDVLRLAAIFLVSHFAGVVAFVLAWFAVGRGALEGHLDRGWLFAWVLFLLTTLAFRLVTVWLQGVISTAANGLLKQRLSAGCLLLDPDLIRGEGTGGLLARVFESDAFETFVVTGGLFALFAVAEVFSTFMLMLLRGNGFLMPIFFALSIALSVTFTVLYGQQRSVWAGHRMALTGHIVEIMAGHRTRMAQQPPQERHAAADRLLSNYLASSDTLDRSAAALISLSPRLWLFTGIFILAPEFVHGTATPASLALGIAAILLGYQALRRISQGAAQIAGAGVAWNRISAIFHQAATRPKPPLALAAPSQEQEQILMAENIAFSYLTRPQPVLRDCSLAVVSGDKVLIEGDSGGGKSTLAAILAAVRRPDSGLLLSGGLDPGALGEAGWRSRVALSPQYHENHIFSAPLAFNLLMSRQWPTTDKDLHEAHEVCRQLGLGPLLDRMPGGIFQVVGETGWQLSQGERSRIFLARTLLQSASLTILDESFAALDPQNLYLCLEFALRTSNALLVFAHP
jgi:ATP-binding cassette subfamily B protein